MVTTSNVALVIIVFEFLAGALLGLTLAVLIRRFHLGRWRALAIAATSGAAFISAIGFAGWVNWSPVLSSEHPRISNFLSSYAIPFAAAWCILAATATTLVPSKRRS